MMIDEITPVIVLPTPEAQVGNYFQTASADQLFEDMMELLQRHPNMMDVAEHYSQRIEKEMLSILIRNPETKFREFVRNAGIKGSVMAGILAGYMLRQAEEALGDG